MEIPKTVTEEESMCCKAVFSSLESMCCKTVFHILLSPFYSHRREKDRRLVMC